MKIRIRPDGTIRALYTEAIDLDALGAPPELVRASHVEPAPGGGWTADLSPVDGPTLGPFRARSEALSAEALWIEAHAL